MGQLSEPKIEFLFDLTIYNLNARLNIMLNTQTIKSLTDLRLNPMAISQLAKDEGPVYIFNRNRPISVILDIEEFDDLMDRFQVALDAAEIKEMKKTAKREDFISHEKLFKELGIK